MDTSEVLERISGFVYWLAQRNVSDAPLMDAEEIAGELFCEIAKGMRYYEDKPMDELLALLRRMCDNRMSELKYKYYRTHRIAMVYALSIDVLDNPEECAPLSERRHLPMGVSVQLGDEVADTATLVESAIRVQETRRRLSLIGQRVFDAVVYPNHNMTQQVLLASMRASAVYKGGGTVKVKPRHVAEALCLSLSVVKRAFTEIRETYKKVREEHG